MNLLFDQNISFRLVARIQDIFPGAIHIKDAGLQNATDHQIWQYARKHPYVIVTFNADFFDMNLIKGSPPRIIWLRRGNTTKDRLEQLLRKESETIHEFLANDAYQEIGCLEIFD